MVNEKNMLQMCSCIITVVVCYVIIMLLVVIRFRVSMYIDFMSVNLLREETLNFTQPKLLHNSSLLSHCLRNICWFI